MTNFTLNDNTTIPVTGFGVFMVPNNGPTEEAVTIALKEGYRLIDTAAAYQNESDVGKAVKKSGIPREEIYVTSKLWLQDYGYEAAKKAIDTSLSKLGLDYMDLYLLHQPYGDTAGAWKALEEAVRAGKIRSIGVSNHTVKFLDKLLPKMEILPVVNQMECNPYFQQKELREYLAKYNIRMEAWYPLGHANRKLLTDKVLVGLAEKYGKSVAQIILRWHYQEGIIALPKATSIEHIRDNISIFDFELTDDDMTAIRALDKGKGTHNPDNMANAVTLGRYNIHWGESTKYPEISKPIRIGSVTVKNRMMMAPMDTGFGNNAWGGFTPEGVEYFVRRAKGGFGLLFSGGTSVDSIVDSVDTLVDHADEFIRTGLEMNCRLAQYDCKMFIQLSMNVGRNAGLKTPSPLPTLGNPNVTTQALTIDEIHTKVRQAAKAAKIVQQAGFAGVDIHAMHWGHLLDSFALSLMNRREDEYGGSLENRLRFAKEIVEAIKAECGKDFPVTMRIALKSYMKGFNKASFDGSDEAGRTLEEAIEICKLLEQYGYDAVSTDVGTLGAFYYAMPPSYVPLGFTVDMAYEVRKAVNIPVLCGGRMADPDINERAISEGKIDAVVIGRQATAAPDYANKILADKPEEVRTCIGCNQGCIWGYSTKGKVGCAVNPEVGYEAQKLTKTNKPKTVSIIGGGVAGMEAARVLTLRGHKVTIFEKSDHLGGNLVPAGAHDFKCEVASLNEYFRHQLKLMDIDVRLNCEMTAEKINALGADAVILALGSAPVMPKIKGWERDNVISGEEALLGRKPVGERIIVVGGGLVGCEIAYGYAKEGRQVTIVEALDELMKRGDVPLMNKDFLLDAFAYYGTQICTSAKLTVVCDEGAVLEFSDGTQGTIPCDTVIMSVGYRPLRSMKDGLTAKEVYEIGDGRQVGNVLTCIADAYKVACEI